MKFERLPYEPGALINFYEETLASMGAICERTWHDRLEVLADGRAASLWEPEGSIHATELHFLPADATVARDAQRDVFPGSPLTFRLAEALAPAPLTLERVVLSSGPPHRAPDPAVAEKLWRAQFPDTHRWRAIKPFTAGWHFSLLVLARCEIQAIDQHWSLHRLAVSLPDGELDENLAECISFGDVEPNASSGILWPASNPSAWNALLEHALNHDLDRELEPIRARQQNSLARELDRIDAYFENYARELEERARRSASEGVKLKAADRLSAAKAEHARRRTDQVARHEIRIHPHFDSLLLVAEPAWLAELQVERGRHAETLSCLFLSRARRWKVPAAKCLL
jgi:hypothetical protein